MEDFYDGLRVLKIWTDPDGRVFENVGVTFRVSFPVFSVVYIESDFREYHTTIEEGKPSKRILDGLIKIVKTAEDRVWVDAEDKPFNPRWTNYLFHKYLIEEIFPDQVKQRSGKGPRNFSRMIMDTHN